ncbi:type II toxin-antitoxin system VapB family antitoxin [Inquilinus limosus]|uniref:Transcription factor n=1 Tax=Inquilinus limosus TaxID=171674 RepID=A0A211ZTM5_9PROT|nr:type II toxin-antitoxin system VapB family antitoxin [Inquilinus limosus]OWJ68642.1 transcription factor [Inquilinus limosus]
MPLSIRDEHTDRLVRELAARKKIGLTEAVRLAVENELRRAEKITPLRERLRPIQDRIAARPATGFEADKAFYDDLSGDA